MDNSVVEQSSSTRLLSDTRLEGIHAGGTGARLAGGFGDVSSFGVVIHHHCRYGCRFYVSQCAQESASESVKIHKHTINPVGNARVCTSVEVFSGCFQSFTRASPEIFPVFTTSSPGVHQKGSHLQVIGADASIL